MKLVKHTFINKKYFAKKQHPTRSEWNKAVAEGYIAGKIILGYVYIDIKDFLSRDSFDLSRHEYENRNTRLTGMDLLL